MKSPMQDPRYWRERAEETRVKANQFNFIDENERRRFLRIAEEYDKLADRAADWNRNADLLDDKG